MFTKSSLNNEFQIFKDHQDYQRHNVDSPAYIPLKQNILVSSSEEENKRKRREYAREYYKKNREKVREQQREYWQRKTKRNHRGDMIGNQKKVYDFLLAQYHRGEDPARGTEIAKALGMSENSVYTAIFHLTKRGYLGRGTYGRYLLLKFPAGEKHKKKVTVENIESTRQVLAGRGYLDELANKINAELITQNKELFEENQKLREQLQNIKEYLNNLDQIMNK